MTLLQALVYFIREAGLNLIRSWKISLLAVATIAVSVFLGGAFLLVSGNLRHVVERWRDESRIVVYLAADVAPADHDRLVREIEDSEWAPRVEQISAEEARSRFRAAFPGLEDLLDGWQEEPLPGSLEIRLDAAMLADPERLETWLRELGSDPAVSMVDDDRDWLAQLAAVILALEALGTFLGGALLLTAVFTISSVIRLTAYLYRDEIAVMRLVGATEFFIRGPFYMEGLIQGAAGAVVALAGLYGVFTLLVERYAGSTLTVALASEFLAPQELMVLAGLGALAGLAGAVLSLRKERLGKTAETPEWETD